MEGGQYRWSQEERATLIAMRAEGATLRQISERLECRSIKAVHNYIKRQGLPQAPRKPYVRKPAPPESVLASEALREASLAVGRPTEPVMRRLSFEEQLARVASGAARLIPGKFRPNDLTGHHPFEARPIAEAQS